ncbi:unnamed protein product, partial [Tetraodon nigroviridis]
RFRNNVLFTSASGELWKMVRIGGQPLGFGQFPFCCHWPHLTKGSRSLMLSSFRLQTNVGSWLRYQNLWRQLTSRPTTLAPSSSTTPW